MWPGREFIPTISSTGPSLPALNLRTIGIVRGCCAYHERLIVSAPICPPPPTPPHARLVVGFSPADNSTTLYDPWDRSNDDFSARLYRKVGCVVVVGILTVGCKPHIHE